MTVHSDDAESIAGRLATQVFYPRLADAVAMAVRHCALEGCALDDDQVREVMRASIEAGDGLLEAAALAIDEHYARRLIDSAGGPA